MSECSDKIEINGTWLPTPNVDGFGAMIANYWMKCTFCCRNIWFRNIILSKSVGMKIRGDTNILLMGKKIIKEAKHSTFHKTNAHRLMLDNYC